MNEIWYSFCFTLHLVFLQKKIKSIIEGKPQQFKIS